MRLIVSESQFNILREAADDEFSLEGLNAIQSIDGRYQYCVRHLGKPIGKGSSRVVFQIDDDKVLKLAANEWGLAQNEEEGRGDWYKDRLGIFPRVYEVDEENYWWLVSEYVLPAQKRDFMKCYGITYADYVKYMNTIHNTHKSDLFTCPKEETLSMEFMKRKIWPNEQLVRFEDYVASYDVDTFDLTRLENLGLVNREGGPQIVILDSGLNQEIARKYYS